MNMKMTMRFLKCYPMMLTKFFFSLIQSHFSIHGRLHTYFVTYLMEMFGAIFFGEIAVFFWFDMRILNQHANDFQIFDLSSQLLYLLLKYELDFVEKIFFWYFSKVVQLFISFIYITLALNWVFGPKFDPVNSCGNTMALIANAYFEK